MNWDFQSVSAACECLNVGRPVDRVAQRVAQFVYQRVDAVVKVNDHVIAPQPLLDLAARDHLAATVDQHQ